MANNASNADQPVRANKPWRRWFQFSLRSLLVFVMVSAVVSSWLAKKIEQKNKERDATAAIIRLGGAVRFDYEEEPGGKPSGPAWLRNLLGEHFFREVQQVTLTGRSVGDAELPLIKELSGLKRLDLSDTKVTDAGLAQLERLTKLKGLILDATYVTDAGLDHVNGLADLEVLCLTRDDISDVGVAKLKGLIQLQLLDLGGTKVTFAGEIDVQRALPNCQITR